MMSKPHHVRCPRCARIYALSVQQLTIAQGLVHCAPCQHTFNALCHLYDLAASDLTPFAQRDTEQLQQQTSALPNTLTCAHTPFQQQTIPEVITAQSAAQVASHIQPQTQPNAYTEQHALALHIFNAKVPQSNLNLQCYLNNLSRHQPLQQLSLPQLNSSERILFEQPQALPQWRDYLLWGILNLMLLILLLLQMVWFNPQLLANSVLGQLLMGKICMLLGCNIAL